MKKIAIYLITFIFIASFVQSCKKDSSNPVDSNPDVPVVLNSEQKRLVNSINDFSFDIFEEIDERAKIDENIFFSPYSINSVLYMLLNGAKGETKAQLVDALEIEDNQLNNLNDYHKLFLDILTNYQKSENIFIANSFWMRNNFPVENTYQEILKKYYNSEVFSRDFSNPNLVTEVNDWISNHTGKMINNMIDELESNAVAILVNAIYFKDKWKLEFEKSKTAKSNFYNLDNSISEVDMMYLKDSTLKSYVNNDIRVLELPYDKSNTKMLIIAPNNKNTITDISDKMDDDLIRIINSNLKPNKTELYMPKFKLKTKLDLNNILKDMGIKLAFTDKADFSNLSSKERVFISRVLHDAAIEVDESGTKAAAATVAIMRNTSAMNDEFILFLNKPFIFLIQDNNTNTILFIGKVNKL